jgi:hypothetical protein
MREHESGRPRTPGRWHPWIKRISNVAAHVSAASLLVSGMASSLAARKDKSRRDDRSARDQADRDRDGGNNRNREDKHENGPEEDRGSQRENQHRSDGDGDGGNGHRGGKHEPQVDKSSDARSASSQQDANTPTPTSTPTGGGGGGGGGNNDDGGGGGGRGDGGNEAGNAGSGFFDRPLATKARRRSNDFDNADRDEDDRRIIVDVDPEGESVYETDSVTFITGPDGLEIQTDNISYFAAATPTPEPLPRLELPAREPGFPFGEDFPFGVESATVRTAAREPSDPGDTGTAPAPRAKLVSDPGSSDTANSDGGDNSMDFAS